MGRFKTEIDLLTHCNIKELKKCKLIGPNDDFESLQKYADNMLQTFIKEQIQYFPNSQRLIGMWIIATFNLRKLIIENSLQMYPKYHLYNYMQIYGVIHRSKQLYTIQKLPNKLETLVGNTGVQLSGK